MITHIQKKLTFTTFVFILLSLYTHFCFHFLNCLSYEHDTPLFLNIFVRFLKKNKKVLYNHTTMIKIRILTLKQYYFLIS